MVELRTYAGTAAEIARFTTGIWRRSLEGKAPSPVWDEAYYDWQLLSERAGGREFMVAAYDGSKLVGSLFAERFRFHTRSGEVDATMASWLTVDPERRREGIGRKLAAEMRRRHREGGAAFCLGFGVPGTTGPQFWGSQQDTRLWGALGFWARVLDRDTVVRWTLSGMERVGLQLLGPLWRPPTEPADSSGIRLYRASDLDDCLALVSQAGEGADLRYAWTRERLAHQLQYRDVPRTLVLERDGRAGGFVNYYRLSMVARTTADMAMVDFVAFGALPPPERKRLMAAALHRMASEGMSCAILPRWHGLPAGTLWGTGWLPIPGSVQILGTLADPAFPLAGKPRLQVHYR